MWFLYGTTTGTRTGRPWWPFSPISIDWLQVLHASTFSTKTTLNKKKYICILLIDFWSHWGIWIQRFLSCLFLVLVHVCRAYKHFSVFKCIENDSISIDNQYGMFVYLFFLTFISARVSEHEVPSDQWAWLVIHEDRLA